MSVTPPGRFVRSATSLPTWVFRPRRRSTWHIPRMANRCAGIALRDGAAPSTVCRRVRRMEARRDDPLVDEALDALAAHAARAARDPDDTPERPTGDQRHDRAIPIPDCFRRVDSFPRGPPHPPPLVRNRRRAGRGRRHGKGRCSSARTGWRTDAHGRGRPAGGAGLCGEGLDFVHKAGPRGALCDHACGKGRAQAASGRGSAPAAGGWVRGSRLGLSGPACGFWRGARHR